MHVSDVPSSPLRFMHYAVFPSIDTFLVHASHSLTVVALSFMRRTYSLFMCRTRSLFMRRTHLSSMCRIHALRSGVAFIYRSCITLIHRSCVTLIPHSCVTLILRSCVALILYLCFSHAARSLLDLLFSLTCIKSQTFQSEYSATIRTSMRADVHIAHCWSTPVGKERLAVCP